MCNRITNRSQIQQYKYVIIVDHGPDKAVTAHFNNCSILRRIKPGEYTVFRRDYYGCTTSTCVRQTVNQIVQQTGFNQRAGTGYPCSRCKCKI